MKKIFLPLIVFLIGLKSFAFHVVIDPGHGGVDTGALRGFFKESHVTLSLALKIQKQLLNLNQKDIQVDLTRDKNITLGLKDRINIANEFKPDLLISLHVNSEPSSSASGMEFYFKKHDEPEKTNNPLQNIINSVENYGQIRKSFKFNQVLKDNWTETKTTIKRAPYYVIENTPYPSVLVEVGFISNKTEFRKLISDDYQNQIAQTVVKAIIDYKMKSLTRD